MALCVVPTVVIFLFVTVLVSLTRGEASLSLSDLKCVGKREAESGFAFSAQLYRL